MSCFSVAWRRRWAKADLIEASALDLVRAWSWLHFLGAFCRDRKEIRAFDMFLQLYYHKMNQKKTSRPLTYCAHIPGADPFGGFV